MATADTFRTSKLQPEDPSTITKTPMRKLIVLVLAALFLGSLLSFTPRSVAAPALASFSHTECNRYCNFDVTTVALPWPSCTNQPGCSVNMNCLFSCWATYQAKLVQINADECAECESFNTTVDGMMVSAAAKRERCLVGCTTADQIADCWATYNETVANYDDFRSLMNGAFATSTDLEEKAARENCEACVENCCDC
jgi:hypothetical protein